MRKTYAIWETLGSRESNKAYQVATKFVHKVGSAT
jgi:hypothetical protein